jgi:hypothetical protein
VAGTGFWGAPRRIDGWREDEVRDDDEGLGVDPDVDADPDGSFNDTDNEVCDDIEEVGVNNVLPVAEGMAEKSDSDQLSRSSLASWSDNRGGNAVNNCLPRSCTGGKVTVSSSSVPLSSGSSAGSETTAGFVSIETRGASGRSAS